ASWGVSGNRDDLIDRATPENITPRRGIHLRLRIASCSGRPARSCKLPHHASRHRRFGLDGREARNALRARRTRGRIQLRPQRAEAERARTGGRGQGTRSEERRVGKECRSRGWAEHQQKKKE